MLSMALASLRSRRAQTIALTLLACLVIGGVVGTPYYLFAVADRLVVRDQANMPNRQRQVDISQDVVLTDGQQIGERVDTALDSAKNLFHLDGSTTSISLVSQSTLSSNKSPVALNGAIAYVDDVCAHVTLTGKCPTSGTDAIISDADATKLGVVVGDSFTWPNWSARPAPLIHIVGTYRPIDPSDPLWTPNTLAINQANTSESTGDAAFVPLDAMKQYASEAVLDYRVRLPVGKLTQSQINDIDSKIADAQFQGPRMSVGVTSSFGTLVDRVNRDINNLLVTVPVLACETLLLGWFALFLVVRATVSNRRVDTGLVRLRGVPRGSTWFLTSAQSALPVLIAAPIGAALGFLGAHALAGSPSADERLLVLAIAAAAGAVVVIGALLAALGASRRGRSGAILDMLRDTPPRRRGWRSDAADIVVLGLAVLAVVQSHSASAQSGLVLVAPALTALAIALIIARAISPISARMVPRMIRSGRVAGLLTATYLARRPGLDRVFTLLMIVTALAVSSVISWRVADGAQNARAAQEVGAAQVAHLRQITPAQLLAMTRSIDPSGRHLMAAVEFGSLGGDRVLAVDSTRLGAVAPGRLPGDDVDAAAIGRLLRPRSTSGLAEPRLGQTVPQSVQTVSQSGQTVSGAAMTLTINGLPYAGSKNIWVIAVLQSPSGLVTKIAFGPVSEGTHDYTRPLNGCVPTCAIVSYSLSAADPRATHIVQTAGPADPGTSVVLQKCNGQPFPPASAWRTTLATDGIGPVLSNAETGGLSASLPAQKYSGTAVDAHFYPLNAPVPVPVVLAGQLAPPTSGGSVTFSPFGGSPVPMSIERTVSVIPRLGRDGLIVDLEYASLLSAGAESTADLEVWMAPNTPSSIVSAVEHSGAIVSGIESTASSIGSYRGDSLEAARRYALLGGALGLALGVIALLLIGAGERGYRSRELAALRAQGITERAMRRAIVAGYGLLCVGAVILGILAAMIGRFISGGQTPVFTDGWNVLALPSSWTATGWLLATVVTAVPLVVTAALVAGALGRDVTRRLKAAKQ